ncbi:hypothetical protein F2981_06595 [Sinorhizobium meliloti]|nr:hypothetical protein [Sinorhizobium meliloti]
MGYNQHLVRSILAIRDQGGITLQSGESWEDRSIIVGRNRDKMEQLAKAPCHRPLVGPISTRRLPIRTTRSSSMPARR